MSGRQARVCPRLGLVHDPATHMGFPSSKNHCFNSKPSNSPSLSHQQGYCLQGCFDECMLYQGNQTAVMPSEIGIPRPKSGTSSIILSLFMLLIIIAISLVRSTGWRGVLSVFVPAPQEHVGGSPEIPDLALSSRTSTIAPSFEPNDSASEIVHISANTSTPELIAVGTATPRQTETVTPAPNPHRFEVIKLPPGSDQGFLVHMVAVGETLDMIAGHYNTTVQAILAVNYKLEPPVWAQYPIVIPLGAEDTTGYPAFEVYVVETNEKISAESLAGILGMDAAALEFYNTCTGNCQFNKGDVLLIPRMQ